MSALRCGVSLVEVLVVLGVIGILLGLLLPAVNQARATSARTKCQNNMRQVGVALQHFHDSHGRLPPLPVSPKRKSSDPNALLSWMVVILPLLERGNLYSLSEQACQMDSDPRHNPPHVGFATVVSTYVCPADNRLLAPLTDAGGIQATFLSLIHI